MPLITRHSIVVVSPQQISCDLAGEAAILDVHSGMYYGLNATGSRIWQLMQEPQTVLALQEVLLATYDVEPERCMQDLLELLQELADHGLIEVRDATTV
jgi:hypothetical protein